MRSLHYIRKFTNSESFHTYFRRYRSVYKNSIRLAKSIYYETCLLNSTNKAKVTWAIVNELRGKVKNTFTTDLKPDEFNDYFCSVAKSLTSKIAPNQHPCSYLQPNIFGIQNNVFLFPPC